MTKICLIAGVFMAGCAARHTAAPPKCDVRFVVPQGCYTQELQDEIHLRCPPPQKSFVIACRDKK
jgi:hypothetical protein